MTLEFAAAAHLFSALSVVRDVFQDFPEVAGVIAGMDDPIDSPWRVEVRLTPEDSVSSSSSLMTVQIMAW